MIEKQKKKSIIKMQVKESQSQQRRDKNLRMEMKQMRMSDVIEEFIRR